MYAIIDIDDTIANTITVWIRRYNRKYKDKLKINQIEDWNLAQYTICGDKIYDFLKSKTLYNYVKPLPFALDGVNSLRNLGFSIVYATGGTPKGSVYKYEWLKNNGFWNKNDHYIQTASKFLIRGEILIDDNWDNINNFIGSMKLLIDAPWNKKYNYKNRIFGWKDILKTVEEYKNG